jgi:osmotically-inducible protein OsmY
MRLTLGIVTMLSAASASALAATDLVQFDPFAQATAGMTACPAVMPRLWTVNEMRTEAHARSERGTRCVLEGTCEPGGAYKRDPEINEQVRAAIAADKRFARTSIWVTTSRKWVTLKGCVGKSAQRKALVKLASQQPIVERVFDELTVGRARSKP